MMWVTVPPPHHYDEQSSSGPTHPPLPELGADLAICQVVGKLRNPGMGDPAAELKRLDENGLAALDRLN